MTVPNMRRATSLITSMTRRGGAVAALCACALLLSACEKTPAKPPTPVMDRPALTGYSAVPAPVEHQSVPSAETALSPSNATNPVVPPMRSDGNRSPSQESTGAVMPGQNNDHSAPLASEKPASAR